MWGSWGHRLSGLVAGAALLAAASLASATPIGFGIWYGFGWSGVVATDGPLPTVGVALPPYAVSPGASPWTLVAPAQGATLTVTDLQADIDSFEVFDFGSSIGITPLADLNHTLCGINPDACIADGYSSASFFLGAGSHSITLFDVDPNGSTGQGAFRVDPVPEPGTLLLIGSGLAGVALRRRRRS
jgi:hypothetical protein